MGFYPNCDDVNKIVSKGFAKISTYKMLLVNAYYTKNDGTVGEGIRPMYIYDDNYSCEYSWRGISKEKAIAQANFLNGKLANEADGSVLESSLDGSNGLRLEISEPVLEVDEDSKITKVTYQRGEIMMGRATAQMDSAGFWSCDVTINYSLTDMTINKPKAQA